VIRRLVLALAFVAGEAAAQKDVADPLEHFLDVARYRTNGLQAWIRR
jgi:hypothetical protein